ncbi:hypothetical protein MNAN1_002985 [Malassezia nana]|uniref:C2H2-type domain-containing protein n=1 Tax=Malassezia nana TaxID=180528 RepID=A0AAF0ETC1_9BASI|nr:hypothetical protein MNAN1_002985 [Malassezia nana]
MASTESTEPLACLWTGCQKVCENAEVLYRHLCDDHVGRISKNNLCLTCSWNNCGASYSKRDHITSHIRIHTPLKPFTCNVCGKSFKRSQDLKKHGRTHGNVGTGASVPMSKGTSAPASPLSAEANAISPGPARDTLHPRDMPENMPTPTFSVGSSRASLSPSSSPHNLPSDPVKHDKDMTGLRIGESVYPSLPRHPALPSYQNYPTVPLLNEPTISYPTLHGVPDMRHTMPVPESAKRPRSSVDDFWNDVRRKRLHPTYDPAMMDRLDNLLYSQVDQEPGDLDALLNESVNYINSTGPLDARSLGVPSPRASLADLNAWLLQLGSSLSRQTRPDAMAPPPPHSHMAPAPTVDFGQVLSQWGLSNIPGMDMVPDLAPPPEPAWMMPPIAPMDRGLQPVYRQVLPLTRAPPMAPARSEEDMDVDRSEAASYSRASSAPAADSVQVLGARASTRERHLNLVLNLLLALNQRKYVDAHTGHKVPISRLGPWSRRCSSTYLWPSGSRRTSPAPAPAPPPLSLSMRSSPATREVRPGALPSIAQLLQDVDME